MQQSDLSPGLVLSFYRSLTRQCYKILTVEVPLSLDFRGAAFKCNEMFFFEIVALSQILKTLEIIDIMTSTAVSATGFYCFAYKVKF